MDQGSMIFGFMMFLLTSMTQTKEERGERSRSMSFGKLQTPTDDPFSLICW